MALGIAERIGSEQEQLLRSQESASSKIRVAMPGIIQEFDPATQTVTVQLAIREKVINSSGESSMMEIPMLLDVPIVFPKAGGFSVTFPVKKGDECLVVFGDMCIDAWWQSGGVQNQVETRRHDLSDGFAIMGVSSVPNAVSNYSTNSVQMRNKSGSTFVEVTEGDVNVKASNVNVNASNATITASTINLNGSVIITGSATLNGRPL